jgi:hypothetical protein
MVRTIIVVIFCIVTKKSCKCKPHVSTDLVRLLPQQPAAVIRQTMPFIDTAIILTTWLT